MKNIKKTDITHKKADLVFPVHQENELLKFLKESMPEKPSGKVKSLLEHRAVSIDGVVTTKYNAVISEGQTVKVSRETPDYVPGKVQIKTPPIIFENSEIIVINKPAGLLSISTEDEKENTAYHIMTEYVRQSNPKNRLFIVHRLDRETSGVLLFAKNEEIKLLLQDNWNELVERRSYVAVVEGKLTDKCGRIESYLRETESHLVYSAKFDDNGKLAITNYKVIKENSNYSMLSLQLETGRKNQIRVHMKELGHIILGDKKYGSHQNPLKRLALHADCLELKHPITGEIMKFKASAPKAFNTLF